MIVMNYEVLRIVMAELVRQQRVLDNEPGVVVKVTGYRPREVDRYPGTSSWWVEHYVDIFWVDEDDEPQCFEWRGTEGELHEAMERLIKAY